ncbi:MAG: ABC transporter substrate-binding protein, partial [Clostridiales bacterium]|nr:ABC transporter substrate-binding protein [Clostridiales bacterium]
MMKKSKLLTLTLVFAMMLTVLAGCGGSGTTAGTTTAEVAAAATAIATAAGTAAEPAAGTEAAPKDKVKIGIVNPTTGPLAGFGEGCPWTENLLVDYVNNTLGGIYFKKYDKKLPIEIVVYDSTSDTTKCAQMAQKLIEEDKVDIIIARHTPETVNPVSAVAERYGVPCVAIEAPVDAWLAAGPYEWTYHSFWDLDMMYRLYSNMWKQAGFGPGAKIGICFANDADGTAWYNIFAERIKADGYVLVDPGQHPAGA